MPDQWRPRPSDALYILLASPASTPSDSAYYPFHLKSFNKPENHLFKAAHGPGFVLIALMTTLPLRRSSKSGCFAAAPFFRTLAGEGLTEPSAVCTAAGYWSW